MSKNLYVGNLSFSVNDESLEKLFSAHGTVTSARVITDKVSGNSRGFGFVEMSSSQEARTAVQELNDKEFDGRNLKVNEAKSRN